MIHSDMYHVLAIPETMSYIYTELVFVMYFGLYILYAGKDVRSFVVF